MRRYKESTYEIRLRAVKAVNKGESVSNNAMALIYQQFIVGIENIKNEINIPI